MDRLIQRAVTFGRHQLLPLLLVCAMLLPALPARAAASAEVSNGGFESGDLRGWTVLTPGWATDGRGAPRGVVNAQSYGVCEAPTNQSGRYHLSGPHNGIAGERGWEVRSSAFLLSGCGWISVKMGGQTASVKVFLTDGTQVGYYRQNRYRNVGYPYLSQGGSWYDMATYVMDLSAYLGREMYVVLCDEAGSGSSPNSLFDDVVTYYDDVPDPTFRFDTVTDGHEPLGSAGTAEIPWVMGYNLLRHYSENDVRNGGFESGDLTDWTPLTEGFDASRAVVSARSYWAQELPYNQSGEYFLNGWELSGNEANTWRVRSAPFRLEGSGWISVKMGGHAAAVRVYRLDGTPVGEFEQSRFRDEDFPYLSLGGSWCDMATYHLDLSPNLGEVLYVELCDDPVRGGWANAFFDDLVTYYPAKPAETGDWVTDGHRANERPRQVRIDSVVGSNNLYSPRNGGFELGDLTGWTVVQADHFYEDDAVVSAEDYGMNAERDRLPYNQSGSFHLSGRDAALEESDTWTLRSSPFTLAGSGYISVKMGGSSAAFQVRTAADGKLIAYCQQRRYNDVNFPHISEGGSWWDMATYVMDLSAYLGQELVIELLDEEVDAGWAHAFFDDVIGYYAERPHTKADTVIDGYHVDTERPTKIKIPWIYFDHADGSLGRFPMEPAKLSHISGEKAAQDTLNLRQYFIDRQNLSRDELEGSRLSFRTNHYDAAGNAYYLGDVENLPAREGVYVVQYRFEQGGRTQTGSFDILSLSGTGSRVLNGGFETGTMAGWTPLTDGFNAEGAVISAESYWGEALPYNQSGSYHLDGWNTGVGETEGWRVRSTDFTLSGSGYLSVRMGGHAAAVRVYQQDGTLIGFYRESRFNDAHFPHLAEGGSWADMGTYVMDLSDHIGETLYLELCDDVISGGWAHAFFDEVVTYYETAPDWENLSDTVKDGGTADTVTILWRLAENLLTASKTRLLQLAPAETVPAAPEEDEALPPEPETAAEAVPDSLPEETSEPTEDAEEPAEERREESEAEPEENPEPGEDA